MKFLTYCALIATASAVRFKPTYAQSQLHVRNLVQATKAIPDPAEVWKYFDKNGDNEWNIDEAKAAFKGTFDYFGHDLPDHWEEEVGHMFTAADTDRNKKVSPAEMGVLLFNYIDADGDGTWNIQEIFSYIQETAAFTKNELIQGWEKKVVDAFMKADTDRNKKVNQAEFFAYLKKEGIPDLNNLFVQKEGEKKEEKKGGKTIPDPAEVWKDFDKNGDGKWDINETKEAFKAGMEYFGHQLPKDWESRVGKMFTEADTNRDKRLDAKEMGVYVFQMIDENDDNEWDIQEVFQAIEALAEFSGNKLIPTWRSEVAKVFMEVDDNRDKKLTMKEVFAYLEKNGFPNVNNLFE